MELRKYRPDLEALLFAYAEPVSAQRLAEVLETDSFTITQTLQTLQKEYEEGGRGICLLNLEDRWQMAARSEFSVPIQALLATKRNAPLSPAALEVLAIIAYNQPVSRSFIEQVRGVDSSSTVQTLLQKGLVEEAGRLDLPGHPLSFATTDVFLRTFGLASLAELPPLHDDAPPLSAELPAPEEEPDGQESLEAFFPEEEL